MARKPVQPEHVAAGLPDEFTALRKATFVYNDPSSYMDDFSYIAAVPTSVFFHGGSQYVSPLIKVEGSDSERWFVEDWAEYLEPDGGATQAIGIGPISDSAVEDIEEVLGVPMYPMISGSNSTDIAAQLALMDWDSSDVAVFALAEDILPPPSVTPGNDTFTFLNSALAPYTTTVSGPANITFTPHSTAMWLEGTVDWTTQDLYLHELKDPNGNVVDYSVESQVFFERSPAYVGTMVPLHFWYPKTLDGTWTMTVEKILPGSNSLDFEVKYHPGFSRTVNVPSNAKWLNASITWDKIATDLNLALVDPTGRLVQWAPAGSLLSGPGNEHVEIPYPMPGQWTIIMAWMDATDEENNVNLYWQISALPSNLQPYLESAANGAVLASLLNAPLLYVTEDSVPEFTKWVAQRLGVNTSYLVDPANIHSSSLETELDAFSSVVSLENYPLLTQQIRGISQENDVVITTPRGTGDELFAPAAFSAAAHGAPVFSLCGTDNSMTTRAEETWFPYLIGPEIDVYITSRWITRRENGWYDERIPNRNSMMQSVDDFESYLSVRGAYNVSSPQSVVILSPPELIKVSFDRSLQSHFRPGRIPAAGSALACVMVNRAIHHRFLFRTAEAADEALLTMYAYTDGASYPDNFYDTHVISQIEDTTSALGAAGFSTEMHVGYNEVFSGVAAQVGLWSMSTHGTLTSVPMDPPSRPGGLGLFALRDTDATWGFEESVTVRESPDDFDQLVNPVAFEAENAHHVMKTTDELEAQIDNIGSPIVIITACLLGGSRLPVMLMEHGAVGVVASPRTVYFQPAGLLSILLAESLCDGNSTGAALSDGLVIMAPDYSDPLVGRDPRDYGNQQVLYGDPEVHLYSPSTSPRLAAVDAAATSYDSHSPGNGVPGVVGLGSSDYLPTVFESLGIEFDYYEASNLTYFDRLLPLRRVVIVEPGTLPTFSSQLEVTGMLDSYVRNGGTLVLMGASGDLDWLPWPIEYEATGTGSSIAIVDTGHPFMSSPNTLGATVDYQGHLSSVWGNLSVLATDGTDAVIAAGVVGKGKLALTTTHPTGAARNATIENAVLWNTMPSLILRNVMLNQEIIWEGDRVVLTLEITNRVGVGIELVQLQAWFNDTSVSVEEAGSGIYTITLTEDWTRGRLGDFDLKLSGVKSGYDSLSIVLLDLVYIRAFPLVPILIVGGVVAVILVGSFYMRRRRGGDQTSWRRESGKTKKERERQRKKDERFDPKEYFGV
ncbi:MAG: hypothetical protein ACFFH0_06065 [Promethearchaeota archaeon]